ncbi:hypothetical protein 29 [Diadegma semiclausum ichnovirus]|nr:hypothetical protein 29 [Diadegma semiclausum ichnovirus]
MFDGKDTALARASAIAFAASAISAYLDGFNKYSSTRLDAWSNYQHARHQWCKVLNQIWLHVSTFRRMPYMDGEHYIVDLNVCWDRLHTVLICSDN